MRSDVCLGGCIVRRQTVFKLLLLQFFSNSHDTWHTRSMCQYAKSAEEIFEILILKFLVYFFKFYIWT